MLADLKFILLACDSQAGLTRCSIYILMTLNTNILLQNQNMVLTQTDDSWFIEMMFTSFVLLLLQLGNNLMTAIKAIMTTFPPHQTDFKY